MTMSIEFPHIIDYLVDQKYPDNPSPSYKRTLRKRAENFLVKDGGLFYCLGWKKMSEEEQATAKLRQAILRDGQKTKLVLDLHYGKGDGPHLGHHKILTKLSQDYYWMGMHVDVRRILKSCHSCMLKRDMITCPDTPLNETDDDATSSIAEASTVSDSIHDLSQFDDSNLEDIFPSSYAFGNIGNQANHFWEKVEMDVIGPYPSSPDAEKGYYVVLFVDSYSSWPEAFVMESFNTSSIAMALFSLISRYGVMSSVVCKDQGLCDDLSETLAVFSDNDCPIMVENKISQHSVTLWHQLKHGVEDFVVSLPTEWFKYLEFCLLPFRISRPEHADYTPSFLTLARELRLPRSISHQDSETRVERHLTETQVNTSLVNFKEMFYRCVALCQERETNKEKMGRNIKVETDTAAMETGDEDYNPDDGGDDGSDNGSHDNGESFMSLVDRSTGTSKRKVRKRGGVHTNDYGNMYLALKNHLLGKGYPPGYTMSMKRSLRKILPCFFLKEDILYHIIKNELPKEVVIDEKDRLKILQKSHVSETGKHFTAAETYSKFNDKYYWKGISLDTQEFVRACPYCEEGRPRLLKYMPLTTAGSVKKQKEAVTYEDCTKLYQPLIEYLKTKELPPDLSEKETKQLKLKAANHVLKDDGSLYLKDHTYADKSGGALMRRVVFTSAEKIEAMHACHVIPETGKHNGKAQTHSSMSEQYYWPHITQEVAKFIKSCDVCDQSVKSETPSPALTPRSAELPKSTISPMATSTPNVSSHKKMVTRSSSKVPVAPASPEPEGELSMETSTLSTPEPSWNTMSPKVRKALRQRLARHERFVRFFNGEGANVDDVNCDHGYSIQSPATAEDGQQEESNNDTENNLHSNKDPDNTVGMEEFNKDSDETTNTGATVEIDSEETRRTTEMSSSTPQSELPPLEHSSLDPLSTAVEMVLNGETRSNTSPASSPIKKGKGKHKCDQCGIICSGYIKLQIHKSIHTGEKPFECVTCGAKVSSTKSLRQHQLRHQGELDRRLFLCDLCGKEFRSKYQLINHKQGQHFNKFTCSNCNKAFSSKAAFTKHEDMKCGVNPLQCKICKYMCRKKSDLRNHVLRHAGLGVREKLRRIGDGEDEETEDQVMQEITQAAANVEIPQVVESVEMQDAEETPVYTTQNVIITENDQVEEQATSVVTHMTDFDSLLGLAEQVVQAQFGDMQGRDVEYQIVYPDNTSQIVILQHEATHRAVQP